MTFPLPPLMLAPNGARLTKADHPELPIMIPEIVACARDCFSAGATGIHAHVRDTAGLHVLDVGLYQELMAELAQQVPDMRVQITSEAAGRYHASEQQTIMRRLKPSYVSVALREMLPDSSILQQRQAQDFYHWAADTGVMIQHILYSADDLLAWLAANTSGLIPPQPAPHLLFVLGRYATNLQSKPEDLHPFLTVLNQHHARQAVDWAVCAFGVNETACLVEAARQGGKMRVGFENSLWNADGQLAKHNRERVEQVQAACAAI